jgi:hypothetical protein
MKFLNRQLFIQIFKSSNEKWLFLLICIVNLYPILTDAFFVTMDGAAHLYNSNLIGSLLIDKNTVLDSYFTFNPELVPNWSGHLILSFLNYFLPSFLAEKCLLVGILILLPYGFRGLLKTIAPDNGGLSYLIFPFTYSFMFILGFYNFLIGLIFLLFALNFWVRNCRKIGSFKNVSILFILLSGTYFSHILVFAILLLLIAIHICLNLLFDQFAKKMSIKEVFLNGIKSALFVWIAAVIPLIFFVNYFLARQELGTEVFLPFSELVDNILHFRSINTYSLERDGQYSSIMFFLMCLFLAMGIVRKIVDLIKRDFVFERSVVSWFMFVAAISIAALYFLLPDSNSHGSIISIRLNYVFFVFFLLWISTFKIHRYFLFCGVIISLFCSFKLNAYKHEVISFVSPIADECYAQSKYIKANSTVFTLNASDIWFVGHVSNYCAVDKPLILTDNYESNLNYFPLLWNRKSFPGISEFCVLPTFSGKKRTRIADYALVVGDLSAKTDSCNMRLKNEIDSNYRVINKLQHTILYKKKLP